jgi:hypothetical protein
MSRDQLSGFMLGLSVGVLVGTLMPPNAARGTIRSPAGEADSDFDPSAKREPTSPDSAPDLERHSVSQSQSERRPANILERHNQQLLRSRLGKP